MPPMSNRLGELLRENDFLYGVICRDVTLTDIELMAQEGYHIVWIDLEHSPQSTEEAIRLGRSVTHLGMVPLVRIRELSRTNVQPLVDGGIQVIVLPDVRRADQAAGLVHLGNYPPLGQRGFSSTNAGIGFKLDGDQKEILRQVNEATHLMVLFESDEGYENLDDILGVEGIDMVGVGPNDWSISLGISGDEAKKNLTAKIERVLTSAARAGKIPVMGAGGLGQAKYYLGLGVRVFFVGVDVAMRRKILVESMKGFQRALGT